jgi:hypothetical protein
MPVGAVMVMVPVDSPHAGWVKETVGAETGSQGTVPVSETNAVAEALNVAEPDAKLTPTSVTNLPSLASHNWKEYELPGRKPLTPGSSSSLEAFTLTS